MAIIVVQAPPLSAEQKRRIGDRILGALHAEGVPAAASIVLFRPEDADLYLDGGLLHEIQAPARPAEAPRAAERPAEPAPEPARATLDFLPAETARPRTRRSKGDLDDLRERLVQSLQAEGALSSFEAQARLGLREDDGAPATLRRLFGALEAEGLIVKQGQKRGTRYVWKGAVQNASPAGLPPVRLVKSPATAPGTGPEADDQA